MAARRASDGGRWRGAVLPAALVIAAELAPRLSDLKSDGVAPPSAVALAAVDAVADGKLPLATVSTLARAALGLALGGGLGLAGGLWFGLSPRAAGLGSLAVELMRPIPPVALIPLTLLMFGFGTPMEATIVGFTCFWPMLLLTHAAVSGVPGQLVEVARVLRLSAFAAVTKIVLPAALPRVFVAFRLTCGIALIVAVTTEIAANPSGLGYELTAAQQELRPDLMYVYVAWLAVLGWALNASLVALEARLFGAVARGGGR
jgi:ABC-type nitrate/sulfonate/bicarbonate transport system permease component